MMNEIQIHLPKLHHAQRVINRESTRFTMICCGRRFGKDILINRRFIKRVLKSGKPCGWFAPTYRMLMDNWRVLCHAMSAITSRISEAEHRIELINGGIVEAWSLDSPEPGRGKHYQHVVINEAAMVKDLAGIWSMIIRPTLADLKGSADIASTPKGLNGFYRLWSAADRDEDWSRFRYPTDANPYIPRNEILSMRSTLPARVIQQELDAQFVENGSFFQNVETVCVVRYPDTPDMHNGHHIYCGVDWAQSGDYSRFTFLCQECGRVVDWWGRTGVSYIEQRSALGEMYNRWSCCGVLPERNSIGLPNIEMLISDGLVILDGPDGQPGFNTSSLTKPGLIMGLSLAIQKAEISIPEEYREELTIYEGITRDSGQLSFSAPHGEHDDRVISLALAYRAAITGGTSVLFGA